MHPQRQRQDGFTLIELMIGVVVIALLGAIAYPLYTAQVQKSRRVEAQASLLELATRQTQWRSRHLAYASLSDLLLMPPAMADPDDSHYAYSVSADATGFEITAAPRGAQVDDSCGTLRLAQDLGGEPAACW